VVDVKATDWNEIGGLDKVKTELKSAILWPMIYPEKFRQLGLRRPKGVLLYGPPGCGKTSIVKAIASMSGATFLYVSAAAIFSPYVGDSEKAVAEVFRKARLGSPSILFIDEIEALVSTRMTSGGGGQSGVQERVLSVMLNEMDGIGVKISEASAAAAASATDRQKPATDQESRVVDDDGCTSDSGGPTKNMSSSRPGTATSSGGGAEQPNSATTSGGGGVMLIGATNRPDMLDPALCRPGRLDRHIFVPPPDETARLSILKACTAKTPLAKDVNFAELAAKTVNYSGADLSNLCKEAALNAMKERAFIKDSNRYSDTAEDIAVEMDDFTKCLAWIRPSLTKELMSDYEKFCV